MNATSPDKSRIDQLTHVVTIEMNSGGVHGYERRNILMASIGALDDIVGPVVVVVAGTSLEKNNNSIIKMSNIICHFSDTKHMFLLKTII